jgi:hypothetical protein
MVDKNYNHEYYLRNKEEINRIKRERYRMNTKYRNAAKKRSRDQTLLRKIQRMTERATVVHARKVEAAFTLSDLCRTINISTYAIFRWRNSCIMPKPSHIKSGRGVYSASQVKYMQMFVKVVDSGKGITPREVSTALHQVWDKKFSFKVFMKALSKRKGTDGDKPKEGKRKTGRGLGKQARGSRAGTAGSEECRANAQNLRASG